MKVIYDTPDSNRDWKSRYFFLEGDSWMCRPGDTDYMPVDTTWGILHPSSMDRPKNLTLFHYVCLKQSNRPSYFAVRRRPQVDIKEFAFLEKIFSKTQPEERTWAKLVTLKTIHWYCDGPEPTPAAVKYEEQIRRRKFVTLFLISYVSYFDN